MMMVVVVVRLRVTLLLEGPKSKSDGPLNGVNGVTIPVLLVDDVIGPLTGYEHRKALLGTVWLLVAVPPKSQLPGA